MEKLFDTANLNDALAAGHRAPIDYTEGGLRIAYELHPVLGPRVSFFGVEGEISMTGLAEVKCALRALERVVALGERQAVEAA